MGSLSSHLVRDREVRMPFAQQGRYVRSLINRRTIVFQSGRVTGVNASANGVLLKLARRVKRGDLLEVRWTTKDQPCTTVFEVCWSKSLPRRAGRRSYYVGCRRVFSTEDHARALRPPMWS